jgi:hypothetical protein
VVEALKSEGTLHSRCCLRPVQYLNNILEQDHRAIKRRVRASRGLWAVSKGGGLSLRCRARRVRSALLVDTALVSQKLEEIFSERVRYARLLGIVPQPTYYDLPKLLGIELENDLA